MLTGEEDVSGIYINMENKSKKKQSKRKPNIILVKQFKRKKTGLEGRRRDKKTK